MAREPRRGERGPDRERGALAWPDSDDVLFSGTSVALSEVVVFALTVPLHFAARLEFRRNVISVVGEGPHREK